MERINPRKLVAGDTIGITAPASRGDEAACVKAAESLIKLGFRLRIGETLSKQRGYLAGTDEERAMELNGMFADPEIAAIICARGGYGTARIAEQLDYELIRANPKIFWGYSDITFLHTAIGQLAGLVTFHGPMLIDLCREDVHPLTLASFQMLINPSGFHYTEACSPLTVLVAGEAQGQLTGGNLSLLVSTLGTPYEVDTRGKLLLIEDIDEEPYRVDRMLLQLRMAGKLAECAGIIVGNFNNSEPKKRKDSLTLAEVFADYLIPAGKPCMAGFEIGHSIPNIAIPLGVEARMSTHEKLVQEIQQGVQA
ncbi:MAG: LD-carboxypeptidase [Gorillibacterium sp.]|nr:LD-carboxypeptidase [Gorillibacterium sp.]